MFARPVGATLYSERRERSISRDDSVEEFSTVTLRVAAHSGQKGISLCFIQTGWKSKITRRRGRFAPNLHLKPLNTKAKKKKKKLKVPSRPKNSFFYQRSLTTVIVSVLSENFPDKKFVYP